MCIRDSFITSHDGFTLTDLVSYDHKHNEANLEDNRDGNDNNLSWNCGVEGPTEDPEINALRARQCRNLIATLLLSQGVPMLLAGDEITKRILQRRYGKPEEIAYAVWFLVSAYANYVTGQVVSIDGGFKME